MTEAELRALQWLTEGGGYSQPEIAMLTPETASYLAGWQIPKNKFEKYTSLGYKPQDITKFHPNDLATVLNKSLPAQDYTKLRLAGIPNEKILTMAPGEMEAALNPPPIGAVPYVEPTANRSVERTGTQQDTGGVTGGWGSSILKSIETAKALANPFSGLTEADAPVLEQLAKVKNMNPDQLTELEQLGKFLTALQQQETIKSAWGQPAGSTEVKALENLIQEKNMQPGDFSRGDYYDTQAAILGQDKTHAGLNQDYENRFNTTNTSTGTTGDIFNLLGGGLITGLPAALPGGQNASTKAKEVVNQNITPVSTAVNDSPIGNVGNEIAKFPENVAGLPEKVESEITAPVADFLTKGGLEDALASNTENIGKMIEDAWGRLESSTLGQGVQGAVGGFQDWLSGIDFQGMSDDYFMGGDTADDISTLGLGDINAQGIGGGLTSTGGATGLLDSLNLQPQTREAPQISDVNIAPVSKAAPVEMAESSFRPEQENLVDTLLARSRGEKPSLSEMQLQRGRDRMINDATSMAASARGQDAGMMQRRLANTVGDQSRQMESDAALLRAQEQQQAEAALANLLTQGRQQDIGVESTLANLGKDINLANLDVDTRAKLQQALIDQQLGISNQGATLQGRQIDDTLLANYLQQALGLEQLGANEVIAARDTSADLRKALLDADVRRDVARSTAMGNAVGAGSQGLSGLFGILSSML